MSTTSGRVLATSIAILVLAGCSGSDESSSGATAAADTEETVAVTPTESSVAAADETEVLLPDSMADVVPGDCVGDNEDGDLIEVPCPGEGTVMSISVGNEGECVGSSGALRSSSQVGDGPLYQYTICLE